MSDVETVLRNQLHDRLDDLEPSTLTAQRALRGGQRARRRRTAIVAATAAAVLIAAGITAVSLDGTGAGRQESITSASGLGDRTTAYAGQFRDGDFAGIRADMTPDTRSALSEAALRSGWTQVVAAYGRLDSIGKATVTDSGNTIVLVPLRFARGAVDMRVTYDEQGAVIGVTLLNAGLEDLPPDAEGLKTRAREVVAALSTGRYQDVYAQFDDTMSKGLPVSKLKRDWELVADGMHGGFVAIGGATTRQSSGNTVVDVFCTMRKGELKVRVSFGKSRKISGMYFLEP
jgi:YD repeat-containing protein